jgi:hypothetical protein
VGVAKEYSLPIHRISHLAPDYGTWHAIAKVGGDMRKTVGQQHGGASLEQKLATDTVLRVNVYGPMHPMAALS